MSWGIFIAIIYGIITLVGGVIGYLKAKSKPSLISGVLSALLLFIAAFLESQGYDLGRVFAQVITIVLIIVFALRLQKTGKFMPSGLMLMTGVFTLIMLTFLP